MDWTASEAGFLQANWVASGNALALPVACPNCLHNGAFSAVVLLPWASSPRGLDDLPDATLPTFPATALVTCTCDDPTHNGSSGCGRTGYIKVQVPSP